MMQDSFAYIFPKDKPKNIGSPFNFFIIIPLEGTAYQLVRIFEKHVKLD